MKIEIKPRFDLKSVTAVFYDDNNRHKNENKTYSLHKYYSHGVDFTDDNENIICNLEDGSRVRFKTENIVTKQQARIIWAELIENHDFKESIKYETDNN